VEYLMIEENPMAALQLRKKEEGSFGPLPMRNNTDKMFYGCGAGYLAGLTSGGLYGFARGMSQSKSKLYRLRVNSVLNSVTRYGPRAGNSMGILTIFWAGLDTAISKLRDDKSDYFNHLSAAFLSGLIFKSTAGIKPALTAGVLMASAVGSYGVYEW
ncbi:Tim17/Tim22/Tim23/Pmp24 family-domain-containing protein, partial [Cladochytrium replicatum]